MDPSDLLSTPEGYASPQQIAQMRLLAGTLMAPKGTQEKMQSWTQPAAQMVQALLGARMMQQAQQREQSLAGAGLGGGSVGGPTAPPPAAGGAPPGPGPDAAADWAKQFEGFSPRAQWDYKQYSNGYGTKAGGPGETITPDVADQRLKSEFGKAYGMVQQRFPSLNPNQTAALADLTYNAGPGWMQGSGLSKAVDAGDWQTAGQVLQQYNHAGGQTMPGLTARRTQEAQLMNAPPSPGQAPNAAPAPSAPGQPQTGTFVPPEFARRQAPITANDVYAARMRGDPKAEELYTLFKQQQSGVPVEMPDPSGIGNVLVSRGDPSHQLRMLPKPEIQKMKAGDIEYPQMLQMTPQGMQNWPVIGGGQGGMPGAQPPQAGGGAAPPGPGGQQPPIQQPTDFTSAAKASVDLKRQQKEAEASGESEGKQNMSVYQALKGGMFNAANQRRNIEAAIEAVNDPSFMSGFAQNESLGLGRLLSFFDKSYSGLPASREVFNAQMAKILQSNFAGVGIERGEELANTNGGRIMKAFFDAEKDSLANAAQTPEGIKRQLEILRQNGEFMRSWGKQAINEYETNGKLRDSFIADLTDQMSGARFTNYKAGERPGEQAQQPATQSATPSGLGGPNDRGAWEAEMRKRGLMK